MYTVNWCPWEDIVNEKFIPLVDNRDRYVISYGGRGSSKSNFEAKKLIYRCLTEKYFRHILIRNTYATIKDSSYQTIKDIIFELGLDELFEFKLQPLEIHCINGNCFLARGCDDTTKLKSIKDPTGAWYEEDIPTEEDFITITTSIRTTKAEYLQETFTINPEVEGNFQDNWFWRRFFQGRKELSFRDKTVMKIGDNEIDLSYTVLHSTYEDNKWIPDEFIAFLLDLKKTNPYYYTIYCRGEWGNKLLGGRFYKNFDIGKNTFNYIYRKNTALHISFDFNVNPYMALSIWQMEGKTFYLIDEIALKNTSNAIRETCDEFKRKYNSHAGGLFIYGDPSGKKEDVGREKGYNYFKEIMSYLDKFKPILRVAQMAPPVVSRGNFINTIFESGFDDVMIYIHEKSVYLKGDLLFGKQAPDGTKLKQKEKVDDIPGVEKYHHFSDTMDYLICMAVKESFSKYQDDVKTPIRRSYGGNTQNTQMRM